MPNVADVVMTCANPSPGFLDCDGSAVSRANYAALFVAIGTKFGAGNGTTTFNLPDFRGRSPLCIGTGTGLTARAMAANGGEEGHLLTGVEAGTGVHSHGLTAAVVGITDPGHVHPAGAGANFVLDNGVSYLTPGAPTQGSTSPNTLSNTTGITAALSGTTDAVAGTAAGSSHNTMHPFLALRFCIFTGVI